MGQYLVKRYTFVLCLSLKGVYYILKVHISTLKVQISI